jgi:hypothetical protein
MTPISIWCFCWYIRNAFWSPLYIRAAKSTKVKNVSRFLVLFASEARVAVFFFDNFNIEFFDSDPRSWFHPFQGCTATKTTISKEMIDIGWIAPYSTGVVKMRAVNVFYQIWDIISSYPGSY